VKKIHLETEKTVNKPMLYNDFANGFAIFVGGYLPITKSIHGQR